MSEAEGVKTSWRSVLLVMAITLHNVPDGLAGGVAFGGIASNLRGATLAEVLALVLDVGLG